METVCATSVLLSTYFKNAWVTLTLHANYVMNERRTQNFFSHSDCDRTNVASVVSDMFNSIDNLGSSNEGGAVAQFKFAMRNWLRAIQHGA